MGLAGIGFSMCTGIDGKQYELNSNWVVGIVRYRCRYNGTASYVEAYGTTFGPRIPPLNYVPNTKSLQVAKKTRQHLIIMI